MSVWSSLTGSITFSHENTGFSFYKAAKDLYDEVVVSCVKKDSPFCTYAVGCNFCLDGESANNFVISLIKSIKSYDKKARIDFTVSVRYFE